MYETVWSEMQINNEKLFEKTQLEKSISVWDQCGPIRPFGSDQLSF